MPNRILREGILTSPKLAKLGWPEEVMYRRLMSLVDDFGRYFADPSVLRGHLYPRQINKVSDSDVGKWLQGIEAAGLVRVYPAQDGERYLELLKFGQQVRAKKSRFPDPPASDSACNQLLADEHLDVFVSESVSEGDKARKRATLPKPEDVQEGTWSDWLALRKAKKAVVSDTVVSEARKEATKAGLPLQRFLEIWCLRGSQGLQASWLKAEELDVRPGQEMVRPVTVGSRASEETQRLLDAQAEHAKKASPMPEALKKFLPKKEQA